MGNYNVRELSCPECGRISGTPICCTKEMEVDGDVFFYEVCGKEEKVSFCCGKRMTIREKR